MCGLRRSDDALQLVRRSGCSGSKRFDFNTRASKLLLPGVVYYQVVFTLPSELSELALANRQAAQQQLARDWWALAPRRLEIVVSQLVLDVCGGGDPLVAQERLVAIENLRLLATTQECRDLATDLMKFKAVLACVKWPHQIEHFGYQRDVYFGSNTLFYGNLERGNIRVLADIDQNQVIDGRDIDSVFLLIRDGDFEYAADFDDDEFVTIADLDILLNELLRTKSGDVNLDGAVDFADFLELSANFGSVGGWNQGDINGDAKVDFFDFLALSSNFGWRYDAQ